MLFLQFSFFHNLQLPLQKIQTDSGRSNGRRRRGGGKRRGIVLEMWIRSGYVIAACLLREIRLFQWLIREEVIHLLRGDMGREMVEDIVNGFVEDSVGFGLDHRIRDSENFLMN